MTEPRNMDEPVTRRELHEALEIWGAELERRITANVTENVTANVTANVTSNLRASVAADVIANLTANVPGSLYTILSTEMARQLRASEERSRDFMRALFDPFRDHPKRLPTVEELVPRVERLEAKVFAPKRSSRPTKRRAAKRR